MNEIPTSENPYAPPKSDPVATPSAVMWAIKGKVLMVRDGAELPEIDLFSKDATKPFDDPNAEPLVHTRQKITATSHLVNLISCAAIVLLVWRPWNDIPPLWILLTIFGIGMVFAIWWNRCKRQNAAVGFFTRTRTLRKRNYVSFLCIVPLICVSIWGSFENGFNLSNAMYLILGIGALFNRPGPSFTVARYHDGWFHLSGIPRVALLRLERISRSQPSLPESR